MAAEDLARALIRLDSDYVRQQVADGDFAEFEKFDFNLSDEERKLLTQASARVPVEKEVAVALLGEDPGSLPSNGEGGPGRGYGYWPPAAAKAIEYVRKRLEDPSVQATFVAWQNLRGDDVPWGIPVTPDSVTGTTQGTRSVHPPGTDEALAELRRSCPVSTAQPGVHLAVRHSEVAAVLTDAEHFSGAAPRTLRGLKREQDLTLQEIEGERHDRLRRAWLEAMRRDAVAAAEPGVREICGALVAAFAPNGRAELVAELARPAARESFHHLVGVPKCDRERVHHWTVEIRTAEATAPAEQKAQVAAGAREALDAWIEDQIARRRTRRDPPDDVLTRLLRAAHQREARISDPELVAQVRFLCRAGTGSTVRLIANVLYELILSSGALSRGPPRPRARTRGARRVASSRPAGAVHGPDLRQADQARGRRDLEPGDEVVLSIASANRDESLFTGGEGFELTRGRVPGHLALGVGDTVAQAPRPPGWSPRARSRPSSTRSQRSAWHPSSSTRPRTSPRARPAICSVEFPRLN